MVVTGGDVLNAIKQHKPKSGSFIIEVHTNHPSSTQYISNGTIRRMSLADRYLKRQKQLWTRIATIQRCGCIRYINPQGSFMTQLVYDKMMSSKA